MNYCRIVCMKNTFSLSVPGFRQSQQFSLAHFGHHQHNHMQAEESYLYRPFFFFATTDFRMKSLFIRNVNMRSINLLSGARIFTVPAQKVLIKEEIVNRQVCASHWLCLSTHSHYLSCVPVYSFDVICVTCRSFNS